MGNPGVIFTYYCNIDICLYAALSEISTFLQLYKNFRKFAKRVRLAKLFSKNQKSQSSLTYLSCCKEKTLT
jgi:hypothetical protein